MSVITNINEVAQAVADFANKYPQVSLNGIYFFVKAPKAAIEAAISELGLTITERHEDATSTQRVLTRLFPDYTACTEFLLDHEALTSIEIVREAAPVKSTSKKSKVDPETAEEVDSEGENTPATEHNDEDYE